MILSFEGKKEVVLSVIKTGHLKLKAMVELQQAHVQKGEHDSVSCGCSWWSVCEKVSLPLSNTLQSFVSPQGRHERMRIYKENMTEKIFIGQNYNKK